MSVSEGRLCYECKMDKSTEVSPVGDIEHPLIVFVRGRPSLDQIRDADIPYGRCGEIIRRILSTSDLDTTRILYTYACLCRSKATLKIRDIRACSIRLHSELRKIAPKIIVPLGREGLMAFNSEGNFKKERGGYQEIMGYPLIPMNDPENLYVNPDLATDIIRDLNFIIQVTQGKLKPVNDPPIENYKFIETATQFKEFIQRMKEHRPKEAAVDLETSGLDPMKDKIFSVAITIAEGHAFVIDWVRLIETNKANKKKLDTFLKTVECIYHNGMFDDLFLQANGMTPNYVHDTLLSSYALDERQGPHGLKRITQDNYHLSHYDKKLIQSIEDRDLFSPKRDIPPFTDVDWSDPISRRAIAEYNGADSDYTFRFHKDSQRRMKADQVSDLPKDILIPAAKHFIRFKQDGLLVDIEYLESLGKRWTDEIIELEDSIRSIKGAESLNLNSVPQIKNFIFKELGLTPMDKDFNKLLDQDRVLEEISLIEDPEAQEYWHTASAVVFTNMKPDSTSMFMLYWLADQHPFPRYLIDYRLAQKKLGTYYEGYKKLIDDTGHLRPDVKIHGTRTGRLSSERPNIHGMPRINYMKRMIISEEGFTMVAPDYSQAEIRMMAHFADDEKLIQTLYGVDIHRAISLELFDLTEEEMNSLPHEDQKIRRRAAKTIAFGLIYGRGAKSLATQMNTSQEETEEFIRKYFYMMPKVRSWILRQQSEVLRNGEVTSLYGRKRRFPLILNKRIAGKAKRQAVNFPIQSSVSDMTLLANIDIIKILDQRGIPNKVGFHIHDGFMFQVPDEYTDEAVDITRQRMTQVDFETDVPFTVDIETGKNWGDLQTVQQEQTGSFD